MKYDTGLAYRYNYELVFVSILIHCLSCLSPLVLLLQITSNRLSNLSILSVPDEGYSRNVFTFLSNFGILDLQLLITPLVS
jgi:hypothetical protein